MSDFWVNLGAGRGEEALVEGVLGFSRLWVEDTRGGRRGLETGMVSIVESDCCLDIEGFLGTSLRRDELSTGT